MLAHKNSFLEQIESYFIKNSYVPSFDKQLWIKKYKHGFKGFTIALSSYEDEVITELYAVIRLDEVEKLAVGFTNHLVDFKPSSFTLNQSFGMANQNPRKKIAFTDIATLNSAMEQFVDFVECMEQRFFEKFYFIADFHKAVNSNLHVAFPFIPNERYRFAKGLVAAKIIAPNRIEELTEAYEHQLESISAPKLYREQLGKLSLFLQTTSFN